MKVMDQVNEEKKTCAALFVDEVITFDKARHKGIVWKLNKLPSMRFVELLQSYMNNGVSRLKFEGDYHEMKPAQAGVIPKQNTSACILLFIQLRLP